MNADRPEIGPHQQAGTNWTVFRVDDNGNCFVVESGLTQTEAEKVLARYEKLHHKQTYWIECADKKQ